MLKNNIIKAFIVSLLFVSLSFGQNIDSDLKKRIENLPILKQAKNLKVLKIMALNKSDYLIRVEVDGRNSEFIVLDDLKQIVFSKARSPITSQEINFPVDMKLLKGNAGFTIGSGKKTTYFYRSRLSILS